MRFIQLQGEIFLPLVFDWQAQGGNTQWSSRMENQRFIVDDAFMSWIVKPQDDSPEKPKVQILNSFLTKLSVSCGKHNGRDERAWQRKSRMSGICKSFHPKTKEASRWFGRWLHGHRYLDQGRKAGSSTNYKLGSCKGWLGPVDRLSCLTTCQLGENPAQERPWKFGFSVLKWKCKTFM